MCEIIILKKQKLTELKEQGHERCRQLYFSACSTQRLFSAALMCVVFSSNLERDTANRTTTYSHTLGWRPTQVCIPTLMSVVWVISFPASTCRHTSAGHAHVRPLSPFASALTLANNTSQLCTVLIVLEVSVGFQCKNRWVMLWLWVIMGCGCGYRTDGTPFDNLKL